MKTDPQFLPKPLLLAVAIALLMMGCTGYQYVSSPRYVPLNETKGEVTANVHLSAVQLGYAFTNNFSVFATAFVITTLKASFRQRLTAGTLMEGSNISRTTRKQSFFFIEPGVQIKGGSPNFKAVFQLCPVINASSHALRYQWLSISSGITMNMNLLYRRADR